MKSLEILELICKWFFGFVYKSKWFQLKCVINKMDGTLEHYFIKEVNILVALNYSNLIKYYFVMKNSENKIYESNRT